EKLEAHPEIGGEIAPDDFVHTRKKDEEQAPADGEDHPALVRDLEGTIEELFQDRLAKGCRAEKTRCEKTVHDGRLHLDEKLVLKPDRERAEDEDENAGDERHGRHLAEPRI